LSLTISLQNTDRVTRIHSITTNKCRHLVIDAGHIAIESNLADKSAMLEIQSKRNQQYTEADYKRLEGLMYDKFSLKLEAAQVRFICMSLRVV
jgi:hypothetical protein